MAAQPRRRREFARPHAKQRREFTDRQVRDDRREVGRQPWLEIFFQGREIFAIDQRGEVLLDVGLGGPGAREARNFAASNPGA